VKIFSGKWILFVQSYDYKIVKMVALGDEFLWGLCPHIPHWGAAPNPFCSFCLDTKRTKKIKKKSMLAFTRKALRPPSFFLAFPHFVWV